MPRKNIYLNKELSEYVDKSNMNLSGFVAMKLKEKMGEKECNTFCNTKKDKKK